MTPRERELLMLELKQQRRERQIYGTRGAPSDDEIRRANARRFLGTTNRNRPRTSQGARPSDVRRWESDPRPRGGFRAGEELRTIYETARREGRASTPFGVRGNSEESLALARRMNVQFRSRTQFAGPNGVLRVVTPSERVNVVGTASRRRRVSPGMVPPPRERRRRWFSN